MANLIEVVNFDAGVYQIETTDPVLGGPSGVTNLPAKNLANRTAYLKKHVDDLESGATVPPGMATQSYVQAELEKLDHKQSVRVATTASITLSGTQTIDGVAVVVSDRVLVKDQGTASQNGIYVVSASAWSRATDANLTGEITSGMVVAVEEGTLQANTRWQLITDGGIVIDTTALVFADVTAGYAPLASPTFTGNPAAPTPAQFDNDTSLATTAFVQRSLGNTAGLFSVSGNATLAAADAGKTFTMGGAVASSVLTLPLITNVIDGTRFCFQCMNGNTLTVQRQGTDQIYANSSPLNSLVLGNGDTLVIERAGAIWVAVGGAVQLGYSAAFGASLAANGYQKLPSGLIVQWGAVASIVGGGSATVTRPVAFTAAAMLSISNNAYAGDSTSVIAVTGCAGISLSQFAIRNHGASVQTNVQWLSIGY